jgi:hypothetical protein
MGFGDERARYATVTAGARVFALLVLAPNVLLAGTSSAILNLSLVAAVWMVAIFADGSRRVPVMPALVVEASLVAVLAGLSLVDSVALLPALVLPTLIGGLVRGVRGALEVLGAQMVVLTATILPSAAVQPSVPLAIVLFTWLMAGLAFGLLAAIVHSYRREHMDPVTPYRDARRLINQLLGLSGELVDGLDPVSICQNIVDLAREELPLVGAVVYTESATGVTALLDSHDHRHDPEAGSALVRRAFATGSPCREDTGVAVPLKTDAGVVAVLAGGLPVNAAAVGAAVADALADHSPRLRPQALQQHTPLL